MKRVSSGVVCHMILPLSARRSAFSWCGGAGPESLTRTDLTREDAMGRRRAVGLAMAVVVALLACGLGGPTWAGDQPSAGAWQPRGNVEFVVGAGPGGENDRVARAIQQVLT